MRKDKVKVLIATAVHVKKKGKYIPEVHFFVKEYESEEHFRMCYEKPLPELCPEVKEITAEDFFRELYAAEYIQVLDRSIWNTVFVLRGCRAWAA
jgi:NAD-dependent DNA ligase